MSEQSKGSEVARLRARIEQEHAASVWALRGLAEGTARHNFIQRRLEHLSIAHEGLSKLLGEQQATALVCEIVDRTSRERAAGADSQALSDEPSFLTSITVRARPSQQEQLAQKLEDICREGRHLLPGTTARYLARNQRDPEEIHIVLIWQDEMEPREQGKALRDFFADLDEVLDWQTASGQDCWLIFKG